MSTPTDSPTEPSVTQPTTESSSNSNLHDLKSKEIKTRSDVWNDFKKIHISEKKMVDGKEIEVKSVKAECNHCHFKTDGSSKSGTTHLRNHLKTCPKKPKPDIRQMLIQASSNRNDGTSTIASYQFDDEKSRYKLAQAIIAHEYPFNMVTHRRTLEYIHSLRPEHRVPSRKLITELCMTVYNDYKKKLLDTFSTHTSRISFTMDKWTASAQRKSYLCVTAHFIDDRWTLQRRVIGFIKVKGGSGVVICDAFMSRILDWNIDRKMFTITVDNDTANDVAIQLAKDRILDTLPCNGDFFHVRCAAHIINLIVQDGLKQITQAIYKVRLSIKYVRMSPQVEESFYEVAKQIDVKCEKLVAIDSVTRWNSTYIMLKVALEYKEAFSRFRLKDNKYTCCPTRDEWNHIETLCNCLKHFFDVTELLSGSNYCTANLLFEEFCEVLLLLNEWMNSSDIIIVQMANKMRKKFMKYWLKANKLFTVAAFLDPRYKLVAIELYYNMIYGDDCARRLNNITSLIKKLYGEYSSRNSGRSQSSRSENVSNSSSQTTEHVGQKRKSRFAEYMESCQSVPAKTDLDIYLVEGVVRWDENTMGKFDVLAWWRGNIGKYPTLSRIARDVFYVPVSTVASESTFSTSGHVIHCHRSRMKKETIEALILAQDWLRAKDGESKLPLFFKDVVDEDPSKENEYVTDEYVTLVPTILGNDEMDEYGSEVVDDDY